MGSERECATCDGWGEVRDGIDNTVACPDCFPDAYWAPEPEPGPDHDGDCDDRCDHLGRWLEGSHKTHNRPLTASGGGMAHGDVGDDERPADA